jgi:signal recognition particle receptor subunit beta
MSTLYTFVIGPTGAGKTTLLESLGDTANYWIDESNNIECRQIMVDDTLDVLLFASLDPTKIDVLLSVSERDLLGYIVVANSTAPETWPYTAKLLADCRSYALLPTVIAANKQDQKGAASPDEVAAAIGVDTMTSAKGVVATNPDSARTIFLQLLYSVRQEIERLDALIAELEQMAQESTQDN